MKPFFDRVMKWARENDLELWGTMHRLKRDAKDRRSQELFPLHPPDHLTKDVMLVEACLQLTFLKKEVVRLENEGVR